MMKEHSDITLQIIMNEFIELADSLAKCEHKTFSPPFQSYEEGNIDILDFYNEFFDKYIERLQQIDQDAINCVNLCMQKLVQKHNSAVITFNIIEETEKLCKCIVSSTTQYFKGFPSIAYDELENVFVENSCHLLALLPQLIVETPGFTFYRTRKGKDIKNRKELFHIPFEGRTKCSSYRFSTLGYPSLYLSESLETALLEVGATNLSEYYFSCFKSTSKMCFVDLALPNRELAFYEHYSLILFYPLIVACGLKVRNQTDPFKPEYIIPQLLTQVIRLHSNHIIGFTYTSTKRPKIDYTDPMQRNYVVYVPNTDQPKGYSEELTSLFDVTEPFSCQLASNQNFIDLERIAKSMDFKKIDE